MSPEDPAIPCGLVAKSYFNDTFSLHQKITDADGKPALKKKEISSEHIAWSSDLDFKFNNIEKDLPKDVENYESI
jgi:hypothetical protein